MDEHDVGARSQDEQSGTGVCPVCGQQVPLDPDGRIGWHGKVDYGVYAGLCSGTGRRPKTWG